MIQKIETNQLLEKILSELQSLSKKLDIMKENRLIQNISDAAKFLEKNSVSFQVVDMKSGHFYVYPLDGSLIQYWAGTGTIVSAEGRKDAKGLSALLREVKLKEGC